jgi:hypothetical protein
MKPKNRTFCNKIGRTKLLFPSKGSALNYIKFNAEEIAENSGYAPNRAYYCDSCGGWHVTHHEKHFSICFDKCTPRDNLEYGAKLHFAHIAKDVKLGHKRLEEGDLTGALESMIQALIHFWDFRTTPYGEQFPKVQEKLKSYLVETIHCLKRHLDSGLPPKSGFNIFYKWNVIEGMMGPNTVNLEGIPDNPRILLVCKIKDKIGKRDYENYMVGIRKLRTQFINKTIGDHEVSFDSFNRRVSYLTFKELSENLLKLKELSDTF